MATKTQRTEHTYGGRSSRYSQHGYLFLSRFLYSWRSHFAVLLLSYLWWKSFFFLIFSIYCVYVFIPSWSLLRYCFAPPRLFPSNTFCYCVNGKWVAWFLSRLRMKLPFVSLSNLPACLTRTKCFLFSSNIYLVCVFCFAGMNFEEER